MQCTDNSGCFPPGKASSHSTALPSFCGGFSCSVCSVFVLPCQRLWGPIFFKPQLDSGCLTCAQCGCVPYTRRGVRHKHVCTRVDSGSQRKTVQGIELRAASDLNSNALNHWATSMHKLVYRHAKVECYRLNNYCPIYYSYSACSVVTLNELGKVIGLIKI